MGGKGYEKEDNLVVFDGPGQTQDSYQEEDAGRHGKPRQDTGVGEVGDRLRGHHHPDKKQRQSLRDRERWSVSSF